MAQIALVDGNLVGNLVEERHDPQRGECRVPPGLSIERRDTHQSVHTPLGCKKAEGVPSLHEEGRRADPGLSPVGGLGQLDVEVVALGPSLVHPQQHLGPIAGGRCPRRPN